ncbi:hypothetical protein [Sulfitobacter sp.]|jgi:hypothetical protein|uniref:hypothetical protein n=1 Tax=Sulfitobacter sp. TaxID=1903071 RepID=UPI000C57EF50|nr:hypothetical protein [Roseobacter sp.]MBV48844.1 hypothetical protein [Roseobacter sp.]THF93317.1 MAG: hypothetical protein E8G75_03585 [Sulfitobacter sp. SK025]|tara:strand:- start:306 stop:653 length:348 start_codon:yes stop_codon:yes gene_type:complete
MVETHQHFGRRVHHLERNRARLSKGYYSTVENDGLIVARPTRQTSSFPFKLVFVLMALFFLYKAFVLSVIGDDTYESRLTTLRNGTAFEQAGAWFLGMDPITLAVSAKIGPLFRG